MTAPRGRATLICRAIAGYKMGLPQPGINERGQMAGMDHVVREAHGLPIRWPVEKPHRARTLLSDVPELCRPKLSGGRSGLNAWSSTASIGPELKSCDYAA